MGERKALLTVNKCVERNAQTPATLLFFMGRDKPSYTDKRCNSPAFTLRVAQTKKSSLPPEQQVQRSKANPSHV